MRIPSQFNDSSLYRPRRGDKNARKSTYVPGGHDTRRRLIRLAVALMLVVVVMRQARKPGVYQTFFGDQKAGWVPIERETSVDFPPATIPAATLTATDSGESNRSEKQVSSSLSDAQKLAPRWVAEMDLPLQRVWIESLIRIQQRSKSQDSQQTGEWAGLSADEIAVSIEQLIGLSDRVEVETSVTILKMSSSLETLRASSDSGSISRDTWDEISWWAVPLLDELDRSALSRVTDGTFWKGGDSDSFYLQLARTDELEEDGVVTTGTLPLLQQPKIYSGERIGLDGTIQLVEKVIAKENRVGISSYWKLWIIPEDGGIRPTVLITRELPKVVTDSLTQDGKWNRTANASNPDGQVRAIGRFIKRIPYRSSVGADLAPVVIGRVVAAMNTSASGTREVGNAQQADGSAAGSNAVSNAGWVGVFLAIVGGIVIAIVLMYRSSVDAKRTRQLRRRSGGEAELNLEQLSGVGKQTDGEGP